jgi:hypothetical protein
VSDRVRRWAFPATVAVLLFGIVAVGSFLVVMAAPDLARVAFAPEATPAPTATPLPTPGSLMARSPIGIEMPAGSDCQGCHVTEAGTLGTREIPVMAHPLWGWRDCTACHSTGSLVASAPGHSSLHKDDCLVCHQTRTETGDASQPPLRPEHMGTDRPCIACHGVDEHAPLPDEMAGRENCWICHNGEEFTYLFEEGDAGSPAPGDEPAEGSAPAGSVAAAATPLAVRYPLGDDLPR